MRSSKEFRSLTLGSAHEKFDVWTGPKDDTKSANDEKFQHNVEINLLSYGLSFKRRPFAFVNDFRPDCVRNDIRVVYMW